MPQLKALSNMVPEIVNFGISVRINVSAVASPVAYACDAVGATSYAPSQ